MSHRQSLLGSDAFLHFFQYPIGAGSRPKEIIVHPAFLTDFQGGIR